MRISCFIEVNVLYRMVNQLIDRKMIDRLPELILLSANPFEMFDGVL